jgi:hypothetical protein
MERFDPLRPEATAPTRTELAKTAGEVRGRAASAFRAGDYATAEDLAGQADEMLEVVRKNQP